MILSGNSHVNRGKNRVILGKNRVILGKYRVNKNRVILR